MKDKNPYNDEDLEACLEKIRMKKFDNDNLKLSNALNNEVDIDAKVDILANRFKNKQKQNNLQRRVKDGSRNSN